MRVMVYRVSGIKVTKRNIQNLVGRIVRNYPGDGLEWYLYIDIKKTRLDVCVRDLGLKEEVDKLGLVLTRGRLSERANIEEVYKIGIEEGNNTLLSMDNNVNRYTIFKRYKTLYEKYLRKYFMYEIIKGIHVYNKRVEDIKIIISQE